MFKLQKGGSSLGRFSDLRRRGFTLIELLVVIFIIGLFVSVNTARSKSRDARRIADMDTIRNAIEMYADANNGTYPMTAGWVYSPATPSNWITGLVPTYIASNVPTDPRYDGSFFRYLYRSNGTDYKIMAWRMESADGQTKAQNDGGIRNSCTPAEQAIGNCAYELFSSDGKNY